MNSKVIFKERSLSNPASNGLISLFYFSSELAIFSSAFAIRNIITISVSFISFTHSQSKKPNKKINADANQRVIQIQCYFGAGY